MDLELVTKLTEVLKLDETDGPIVKLNKNSLEKGRKRLEVSLVGKVICLKPANREEIENTMKSKWKINHHFQAGWSDTGCCRCGLAGLVIWPKSRLMRHPPSGPTHASSTQSPKRSPTKSGTGVSAEKEKKERRDASEAKGKRIRKVAGF
uniref:Uncharacterized protein n=1 Tax=Cannabis sativa TaxID=3483 RepID=A0A803QM52_CANSA